MEDPIKTAFTKVKADITSLENEMYFIKQEISEIKTMLLSLHEILNNRILHEISENNSFSYPTHTSAIQHITPTQYDNPTHNPTVPLEVKGLKSQNIGFSIGNGGVPTNQQTNRQTDQQTGFYSISTSPTIESDIKQATEILDSLDRIKKEIRYKFKQLSPQEMVVFSTIYQLEEKDPLKTTYHEVAKILRLSESSVRDYTQRIIKKGIPIKKQKLNNKQVLLSISEELKKIATLSTIIQLREL